MLAGTLAEVTQEEFLIRLIIYSNEITHKTLAHKLVETGQGQTKARGGSAADSQACRDTDLGYLLMLICSRKEQLRVEDLS